MIPVRSSGEKVFYEVSGLLPNKLLAKATREVLLTRLSDDELRDFLNELGQELVVRDLDGGHIPRYSFALKPAQKPNARHRTVYLKWEKMPKDLYFGMHYFHEKGHYYIYEPSTQNRQIVYSAGGLHCFKLNNVPLKQAELSEATLNQLVEKIDSGGKDTGITFHLKQIYPNEQELVFQYPYEFTQAFGWNRRDTSFIEQEKLEATLERIKANSLKQPNYQANSRTTKQNSLKSSKPNVIKLRPELDSRSQQQDENS